MTRSESSFRFCRTACCLLAGLLAAMVTRALAQAPAPVAEASASSAGLLPESPVTAAGSLHAAPPSSAASATSSSLVTSAAPAALKPRDPEEDRGPGYNWRGLMLQSFAFISIEDAVRLAADNTLRSLIVEKPFWHDYTASLRQFNMRRWNDGDDFPVNYIGHPMQGSISGYLALQNSPSESRVQWGERGYFRSRAHAMLWSTVFSTYSEVGPTGEAGIGNEGGFTYDLKCLLHCNLTGEKPSGRETNNTGWVDFVVTPTAGTLWMFAEDFVDRKVTGPMVERNRSALLPKILRGSLNPTRTFANGLRGRLPWYRDWDYPVTGETGPAVHWEKAWENADGTLTGLRPWPRVEIAPHSSSFATTVTTRTCRYCVRMTEGYGVETSVRLRQWLYADTDVSYQRGASPLPSDRAGGDLVMGYFGLRGGYRTRNYALNLAVRPGFAQFHNAYLTSPDPLAPEAEAVPEQGTITHFAWNTMVSADYNLSPRMALRVGVQESVVRYRNACLDASGIGTAADLQFLNHGTACQTSDPGVGTAPYFTFLSHQDFVNRGSWGVQFGPVFRFGSSESSSSR